MHRIIHIIGRLGHWSLLLSLAPQRVFGRLTVTVKSRYRRRSMMWVINTWHHHLLNRVLQLVSGRQTRLMVMPITWKTRTTKLTFHPITAQSCQSRKLAMVTMVVMADLFLRLRRILLFPHIHIHVNRLLIHLSLHRP